MSHCKEVIIIVLLFFSRLTNVSLLFKCLLYFFFLIEKLKNVANRCFKVLIPFK